MVHNDDSKDNEKKEQAHHKDEPIGKSDVVSESNANKYFLIAVVSIVVIFGIIFSLKFLLSDTNPIDQDSSYLLPEPEIKEFMYNNYTFNYRDGKWHVALFNNEQVYDVPLKFSPQDMYNVDVEGEYNEEFGKGGVYITFNPRKIEEYSFVALAAAELSLSMNGIMGIKPISACTTHATDVSACWNQPVANCDSEDKYVIELIDSEIERPKITYSGNCITLEGKDYDLVKASDYLLYSWFNVIE